MNANPLINNKGNARKALSKMPLIDDSSDNHSSVDINKDEYGMQKHESSDVSNNMPLSQNNSKDLD